MPPHSIVILGGTGPCGLEFLSLLASLETPPTVIVYARSPAKLKGCKMPQGSKLVEGSLSELKKFEATLKEYEVDTVVSFLGAPASLKAFLLGITATPIAHALPGVLEAADNAGVQRFLALSTGAHRDPGDDLPLRWRAMLYFPLFAFPQATAEMAGIGNAVASFRPSNGLTHTILRVPQLVKSPSKRVHAGLLDGAYRGGGKLSRKSLAEWVWAELLEPKWVDAAPALGH